jgi:hypothetical protein
LVFELYHKLRKKSSAFQQIFVYERRTRAEVLITFGTVIYRWNFRVIKNLIPGSRIDIELRL